MRGLVQIAALLAAFAAAAAPSPIAGTNDFTFTRVTHTDISGTVMGDAGDYRTMRHEDLAWLREAVEERLAFTEDRFDFTTNVPNPYTRWEFGRWGATDTNGTAKSIQAVVGGHATQTVARAWAVTNLFLPKGVRLDPAGGRAIGEAVVETGLLAGHFSHQTNELATSPTVGRILGRYDRTSVVERTELAFSVTQRFEFVRHSLADGTEEVHTNKVYYLATNRVRHVSTNLWSVSELDLCAKSGRFAWEPAEDVALSGLFRSSPVTNAYATVRRCSRPVVTLYPTNAQLSSVSHADRSAWHRAVPTGSDPWDGLYTWETVRDRNSETFTNGILSLEVTGYAVQTRKGHRYRKYDREDGDELDLGEVVDEHLYLDVQTPIAPDGLLARAPFRLSAVTAGGREGSPRVAGGDFFLVTSVDGSIELTSRHETTVESAVTNAVVIVPVSAEIDLGGDPKDMAVFRVGGDLAGLLWSAAEAAGMLMPTSLGGLNVPSPPGLTDDEEEVGASRDYTLTVEPRYVIGVLRLDPTTKLEGW